MTQYVKYSYKLAQEICAKVAQGTSINKISQEEGMPSRKAIYKWITAKKKENKDDQSETSFDLLYAHAFDLQADIYFDKILTEAERADPTNMVSVNKAKLLVDTLKWIACRKWARKYDAEYIRMTKQDEILKDMEKLRENITDRISQVTQTSVKH
jgi:transposase-like protein